MRAADSTAVTPADVLGALNDVELKYAPRELHLAGDRSRLRRGPPAVRLALAAAHHCPKAPSTNAASAPNSAAQNSGLATSSLAVTVLP